MKNIPQKLNRSADKINRFQLSVHGLYAYVIALILILFVCGYSVLLIRATLTFGSTTLAEKALICILWIGFVDFLRAGYRQLIKKPNTSKD